MGLQAIIANTVTLGDARMQVVERPVRKVAKFVCDAGLVGCAALAVVGAAGPLSSTCDQVNNLAPVWSAVGLAAAAGSLALGRRRRPRVVMTAAIAMAALWTVAPEMLARPAVAAGPRAMRVLSFNVWKQNPDLARAAEWIKREDADVLVLTEVTKPLREMLDKVYPHSVSCLPNGSCSTVIYSRRPITDHGTLAGDGDPERRETLSGAWVTVDSDLGPVTVVGLHLDHPWPLGTGRDEMTPIAEFMATRSKGRVVVAGDMNRTPWSHALGQLDDAIGIDRVTRALPTWPAGGRIRPLFPIDHVYAGDELAVHSVQAGPFMGSDHLPIIVDLGNPTAPAN